jgi:hypothetical protein
MKRWSATLLAIAVCSAVVHADVTIVQKTTIEGGMASMAPGGAPSPTMTTRIKGLKARLDLDMGSPTIPANVSTISDIEAKQVILLDHNQKTARISNAAAPPPAAGTPPAVTVNIDSSVKPTGQSQTIDGLKCDEYAFVTSMSLADMGGTQMPPEAAAAMQGVNMVMKGSMWVAREAPGAAEYVAYQKAMTAADLTGAALAATGVNLPGMDKMAKAMAVVQGVPVLTEMTMSIEGQGEMAEMMKQMGAMRVTTKVLSMKTDAIGDDLFKVPEGYQVIVK